MTHMTMIACFILDFLVVLLIPIKSLFRQYLTHGDDDESYEQKVFSLNFYYTLESSMLLFIADGINGYLAALTIIFSIYFFKFDALKTKSFNQNSIANFLTFLLFVSGRFLSFGLMVFQIIAIRCFETSDVCSTTTDPVRLYINIIGLILNVSHIYA